MDHCYRLPDLDHFYRLPDMDHYNHFPLMDHCSYLLDRITATTYQTWTTATAT